MLILALAGLGLQLAAVRALAALSYGHEPGPVMGAALVQLPAVWALAGLAVLRRRAEACRRTPVRPGTPGTP